MDASSLDKLPRTTSLQRTTSTDSLPKLSQLGKSPPQSNPLAFQRSNSSSSLHSPPSLDVSDLQSQLDQRSPAQLLQEKPPVKPTRLQQALTQGFAPVEVHNHFTGIATTKQLFDQMQQVRPENTTGRQVAQEHFVNRMENSIRKAQIQDPVNSGDILYSNSGGYQELRAHGEKSAISLEQTDKHLGMGSGFRFGDVYYFRNDWSYGIRQQNTPLPSQTPLQIQIPQSAQLMDMWEKLNSSKVKLDELEQTRNASSNDLAEIKKEYEEKPDQQDIKKRLGLANQAASKDQRAYSTAQTKFTKSCDEYKKAVDKYLKSANTSIDEEVTRQEVHMAVQSLARQGIQYAEVQISTSQAEDPVFIKAVHNASQTMNVDTRLLIAQSSNKILSGGPIEPKQLQELKQLFNQQDSRIMGIDFNGHEQKFTKEGMENFAAYYFAMSDIANEQGLPLVLRPHVGEGDSKHAGFASDAQDNIGMLLDTLEQIGYNPNGLVKVRLGHATHANPEQISRMNDLGITAIETNISSNEATGSIETMLQHPLISQLIYEVPTILNTDGGGVMRTDLQKEYRKAQAMINDFLNDQLPVTIPHDKSLVSEEFPAQMRFSDFVIQIATINMYNRMKSESASSNGLTTPNEEDRQKADNLIREKVQLDVLIKAGVNYWNSIPDLPQPSSDNIQMQPSSSSSSQM